MNQKPEVVRLSVQLPVALWESLEQIKKGGGGSISSQIVDIMMLHEATLSQLAEAFRALGQTRRMVSIDRERLAGSLARLEVAAAPLVEEATRVIRDVLGELAAGSARLPTKEEPGGTGGQGEPSPPSNRGVTTNDNGPKQSRSGADHVPV